MAKYQLSVNGKEYSADVEPNTPLLWVLREHLGLTGTKFGCGVAQCGACTIHLNGTPMRSCVYPVSAAVGSEITTIEGLSDDNSHPLQKAFIDEQVPQCGYCQSGQIMQAASLLQQHKSPTRDQIVSNMNGILCRCGTYTRIVKAIEKAAQNS